MSDLRPAIVEHVLDEDDMVQRSAFFVASPTWKETRDMLGILKVVQEASAALWQRAANWRPADEEHCSLLYGEWPLDGGLFVDVYHDEDLQNELYEGGRVRGLPANESLPGFDGERGIAEVHCDGVHLFHIQGFGSHRTVITGDDLLRYGLAIAPDVAVQELVKAALEKRDYDILADALDGRLGDGVARDILPSLDRETLTLLLRSESPALRQRAIVALGKTGLGRAVDRAPTPAL